MLNITTMNRTDAAGRVVAVWVTSTEHEAKDAAQTIRRNSPGQPVRVVRRQLSALGASFPVWCVVISSRA